MAPQTISPRRRAPGPLSLPVVGNLPDIGRDAPTFLMSMFRTYGDVVGYKFGPMQGHLVAHPDYVRHVLQEHVRNYTKDHFSYGMIRTLVGNGLLTSQGDFWLRQRRLAAPAFHRQRIAGMTTAMVKAASDLADEWEQRSPEQTYDVSEDMTHITLRIVGEALFGADVRDQTDIVHRSFLTLNTQMAHRLRTLRMIPPVLPTRYDREFREALNELNSVVYAIIAERRRTNTDTGDLLSMLMLSTDEETGERMDDQQLHAEVVTMLLAGHETTAVTLTWAFAMIDRHPEVAERFYAEIDALGHTPTVEDLGKLTYTRMIVDETLRLYPPIIVLGRKVKEDDEIGGYYIKAGSLVDVSPYVTHRHPLFWEHPDRFYPEHFTPERTAKRPKFAYFPFSAGPRQCIGNNFALIESTLVLATLGQRFRVRVPKAHSLEPVSLLSLRPAHGMPVSFERR